MSAFWTILITAILDAVLMLSLKFAIDKTFHNTFRHDP